MANKKFTVEMIDDYQNRLTGEQKQKLITHCNRYNIPPVICAWYDNLNDFYSDWVEDLGYTKTQAKNLLKNQEGNTGEFKTFPNGEIVRLVK